MSLKLFNDEPIFILSLSVCLFVTNKPQNDRTNQAQILSDTSAQMQYLKQNIWKWFKMADFQSSLQLKATLYRKGGVHKAPLKPS